MIEVPGGAHALDEKLKEVLKRIEENTCNKNFGCQNFCVNTIFPIFFSYNYILNNYVTQIVIRDCILKNHKLPNF